MERRGALVSTQARSGGYPKKLIFLWTYMSGNMETSSAMSGSLRGPLPRVKARSCEPRRVRGFEGRQNKKTIYIKQ